MDNDHLQSPRQKLNQVKPLSSTEELERESKDIVPPSELKLLQLKTKNQVMSSEELKFISSPHGKVRGSKAQSPKKRGTNHAIPDKKKNQRVSFNEQINKIHYVENWKIYNMENSVSKNGSHCCLIM